MGKKTKNAKKNKFVVPLKEAGDNAVQEKVIGKKAKKNKIIGTLDNNNVSELSEPKPKKAKPNAFSVSTEVTITNKLAKKGKKNKMTEPDDKVTEFTAPKAKKAKKNKPQIPEESSEEDPEISAEENETEPVPSKKIKKEKKKNASNGEVVAKPPEQNKFQQFSQGVTEEMIERYPVLGNEELVYQFLAVKLTSTQKGRMRQIFKASLQGTPEALIPDMIDSRMKIILKTPTLTETALRKLRILYSMLKTTLMTGKPSERKTKIAESKDGESEKIRGPKRWVVFIGNLPLGTTEEKIKEHFSDLGDNIKDVRIPKKSKDPKSAIAYMEVTDNLHFELALSKHHTMLDNRRIKVLYTAQSGSKMTKTEAKGKAAKLVALQKSGKLAGSVPLSKKRSARRKKMKAAQAQAQAS